MTIPTELFISVDVETSGPVPGEFSLLTIGACLVDDPERAFSCALKPVGDRVDPKAMAVTGLSVEDLRRTGREPDEAMRSFAAWVADVAAGGVKPVFVGLNAPFDWSFVNYYFHRFTGTNPFGFTALDIKAYYMGATGCSWGDTRSSALVERLRPSSRGNHDALDDARHQAELFRLVRDLASADRS